MEKNNSPHQRFTKEIVGKGIFRGGVLVTMQHTLIALLYAQKLNYSMHETYNMRKNLGGYMGLSGVVAGVLIVLLSQTPKKNHHVK